MIPDWGLGWEGYEDEIRLFLPVKSRDNESMSNPVRLDYCTSIERRQVLGCVPARGEGEWPTKSVETIDEDQGRTATASAHRHGFKNLMGEIGAGQVGVVLALEASRLVALPSIGTAWSRSASSHAPSWPTRQAGKTEKWRKDKS
jgi:hypothetical protein